MRQQVPLEAFIMLPNGSVRMPKEALVVVDDIRDHQPNDGKDDIFGSEMKSSSTSLDGGSGHGSPNEVLAPAARRVATGASALPAKRRKQRCQAARFARLEAVLNERPFSAFFQYWRGVQVASPTLLPPQGKRHRNIFMLSQLRAVRLFLKRCRTRTSLMHLVTSAKNVWGMGAITGNPRSLRYVDHALLSLWCVAVSWTQF